MRHLKRGRKLGRSPAHRQALLRSLAASLFRHESIVTTGPKAKFVQGFAERLITVAKRAGADKTRTVAVRRLVASRLQDEEMAKKVCEELAVRFANRVGGYTRIFKLAEVRKGDAGSKVRLELTEIRRPEPETKDKKGKKGKKDKAEKTDSKKNKGPKAAAARA